MTSISSAQSGTFKIGGDIEINRLGFGAMRITGPGIWGEPADRPEASRTLKRLPALETRAAAPTLPLENVVFLQSRKRF
jgi:pyridoxine 4-dehydrogenase